MNGKGSAVYLPRDNMVRPIVLTPRQHFMQLDGKGTGHSPTRPLSFGWRCPQGDFDFMRRTQIKVSIVFGRFLQCRGLGRLLLVLLTISGWRIVLLGMVIVIIFFIVVRVLRQSRGRTQGHFFGSSMQGCGTMRRSAGRTGRRRLDHCVMVGGWLRSKHEAFPVEDEGRRMIGKMRPTCGCQPFHYDTFSLSLLSFFKDPLSLGCVLSGTPLGAREFHGLLPSCKTFDTSLFASDRWWRCDSYQRTEIHSNCHTRRRANEGLYCNDRKFGVLVILRAFDGHLRLSIHRIDWKSIR